MAHLLDSDIVIYQINGVTAATQLVDPLLESGVSISSITFLEVSDGLERTGTLPAVQFRFSAFAERVPVIPVDRNEAIMAARVRRALRDQGRSICPSVLGLLTS